ncbi:LysR family transcriptional regulator [Klebsiella variicola]|uniref:LysR family transcriptional regulator n=2 Tax=Klebsiella variicola TaxID=244366 RepID=UPI0007CC5873|nr:LysR family transcriptional regulator [Klebsiella variicola]MCE0157351.1 LysR family transcriptional regulator [Klebsiella variicola subsp. variicola]GKL96573.1 hypothetical protein NUKP64_30040 [Klebsiella variicola]SBH75353.1 LysR family transcriptional regulator [Klebsiella variicola]
MKPTLNQLINFCTVAETGNIGKAASQLNISQPPLSRQIAQLETILGAKLFNRAAKGVSLTLAGEQFLLDCRAMLAMLEQACNNVRAIESGQKGVLNLSIRALICTESDDAPIAIAYVFPSYLC